MTSNKQRKRDKVYKTNPVPVFSHVSADRLEDYGSMSTVINKPEVEGNAFSALAYGLVSFFQSQGGAELASDPSTVNHAWIYIAQALESSALGTTVEITEAPYIMAWLGAMLVRKDVAYMNGRCAYSAQVTTSVDQSSLTISGGPANGVISYCVGQIDNAAVVDGNIPLAKSADAYTDELGRKAFQIITDLFRNSDHEMLHMARYPLDDDAVKRDNSMYAFATYTIGGGLYNIGGWQSTLSLETRIKSPLFGKVCLNKGDGVNLGRAANFSVKSVGDAVFAAVVGTGMLDPQQLNTTRPAVIKPLDLNRVIDIMARVIHHAIRNKVETADFIEEFNNKGIQAYFDIQYPITFQRLSLLIRSAVMTYANVYQLATQTSYPVEEIGALPSFRPLAAGCGQSPMPGARNMRFPTPIAEMLAATMGFKVMNTDATKRNPYLYCPQWGVWGNERLNEKDYYITFFIGESEYNLPIFAQNPVEPLIDLVDGSTGNKIAWINSSGYLEEDIEETERWNNTLGSFLVSLSNVNADGGIELLTTLTTTTHVFVDLEREEEDEIQPELYIPDRDKLTVEKVKEIEAFYATKAKQDKKRGLTATSSVFDKYKVLAITSLQHDLLPITTGVSVDWMRPTNVVRKPLSSEDNTILQTFQQNTGEMNTLIQAQGTNYLKTLTEMNDIVAESCVRAQYAPESMAQKLYSTVAADGNGGILGDMIQAVAGPAINTGIRAAAPIVGNLAEKGVEIAAGFSPI